jgi:hypothetical protein
MSMERGMTKMRARWIGVAWCVTCALSVATAGGGDDEPEPARNVQAPKTVEPAAKTTDADAAAVNAAGATRDADAVDARDAFPPEFFPSDPQPLPQLRPTTVEPAPFQLARQGGATMEDAYRTFLLMAREHGCVPADLCVETMSFADLECQLKVMRIISPRWCYRPTDCLHRDTLAYMSCQYLGIRPGLLTGLFGMTRRYAHREMLYRDLIGRGNPHEIVSGSELLSVSTRIAARVQPRHDVSLTADEIH